MFCPLSKIKGQTPVQEEEEEQHELPFQSDLFAQSMPCPVVKNQLEQFIQGLQLYKIK